MASAFRSSPHDAAIASLALPAILALAADPLLQVVDTVFVGQAGPDALAALGVNSALFTFSFVVFNFLATATTPLVATALATGDKQRAGTVTVQALVLATGLGAVLAAVLTLGADQALALMGADTSAAGSGMYSMAKEFLLIRALASPAVLLTTVGQGAFRGLQDMRTPLTITLAANGINLALDIALIVGLGWGVKGAATATSVAEWVAAVSYLALLWRRREELGGLDVRKAATSLSTAAADFAPFLSAGGAVLMRTALLLGTKTLASATAARLGPVPIASHQVVMQLWLLSSFVIDSLAVAGQSLIAVELGRGDRGRAREVSNRLLQLGVGSGIALGAAFWAAEPIIPEIFSNDAAVQATVLSILPIAVGMLPINAAVYVLDGILVGSSDFQWMAGAMVLAAATATGLLLGVEPLNLGLQGVWGALAVLMTSRLATLLWRYTSPKGPLALEGKVSEGDPGSLQQSAVSNISGLNSSSVASGSFGSIDLGELLEAETNVLPVLPPLDKRAKKKKEI